MAPRPQGSFHVRVDTVDVRRNLRGLSAEAAPYVAATALTWTAQDIRQAEYATMQSVFDRPTRWTMNALQVIPANKNDLQARVEFKGGFGSVPAWRYLGPQVEGGTRVKKTHERALERAGILRSDEYVMPGAGASIDASGNMRASEIVRILSQIKASSDPTQNASNSRRSRRKRKATAYFVSRGRSIRDGVYLRRGSDRSIVPVMIFTKAPRYQPRFPYYDVARQVIGAQLMSNARVAWDRIKAKFAMRRGP